MPGSPVPILVGSFEDVNMVLRCEVNAVCRWSRKQAVQFRRRNSKQQLSFHSEVSNISTDRSDYVPKKKLIHNEGFCYQRNS